MNFTQAISTGISKIRQFFRSGPSIGILVLDAVCHSGFDRDWGHRLSRFSRHWTYSPLNSLAGLALFLPGIAVSIRRLHDLDRTGWWLLLILTIIGGIVLLAWFCMRGTVGPNRFGPDPLEGMV